MRIFQAVFSNFLAKIFSLLIAIAIWIYVGSGLAQIGSFPGQIPIQFKNVSQGLVAVSDTQEVSVKIVAAANLWRNLNVDSFLAEVNLQGLTEGTYELPIQVNAQNSEIQIIQTDPQKIIVRLEKISEKEVPIILQVDGKPADGLVVGDWKIDPPRVKVSGASSMLEKIFEATAKVTLNGEKDNLERILKVVALDASGNEIRNLSFNPAQVKAQIPLVKASSAKTVGIKVLTTGQPAPGFWVSGLEAQPSSVAVTASTSLIGDISFVETQKIDVSGLAQAKEFTTTINPVAGVTILDSISVVKVKVIVAPISSTRQFEVGFNWRNLNPNLKVVSVDPDKVTIVVAGATADLSRLTAKDILVNIDLGSFYQPGTYSVDISRSNITLASNMAFSSVVPSAVSVRLENL